MNDIWQVEGNLLVNKVAVRRIADGYVYEPFDCYIRHGEEGKFEAVAS